MRCVAAFWRKPSGTAPAREAKGSIARQHFGESHRELRRPGSQKAGCAGKGRTVNAAGKKGGHKQPLQRKRKGVSIMELAIGHLYPDLLNLYGDRGNIQCFQKRLAWRGIEPKIVTIHAGEGIDFHKLDLVLLGGGSDREQELACKYLKQVRQSIQEYIEDGGVLLAICGGYQLLGNYYKTNQATIEGLGVLDIHTEWKPKRLTGDIVLRSRLSKNPIGGFENHGGRTYIGDYAPLGKVASGYGNTGKSGKEGIVYKNLVGTYLHGPLLPKNPEVCDYLLKQALRRKYGKRAALEPLSDGLEQRANRYIAERAR